MGMSCAKHKSSLAEISRFYSFPVYLNINPFGPNEEEASLTKVLYSDTMAKLNSAYKLHISVAPLAPHHRSSFVFISTCLAKCTPAIELPHTIRHMATGQLPLTVSWVNSQLCDPIRFLGCHP